MDDDRAKKPRPTWKVAFRRTEIINGRKGGRSIAGAPILRMGVSPPRRPGSKLQATATIAKVPHQLAMTHGAMRALQNGAVDPSVDRSEIFSEKSSASNSPEKRRLRHVRNHPTAKSHVSASLPSPRKGERSPFPRIATQRGNSSQRVHKTLAAIRLRCLVAN